MNNLKHGVSKLAAACSCNLLKTNTLNTTRAMVCRGLSAVSTKTNFHKFTPTSTFVRGISTRGDREIFEFLQSEIAAEKKTAISQPPTRLGEFDVTVDKAFVTLKRKFNEEIVTVSLDVNHSVDAETPSVSSGGEEMELKSKPSFEVDVKKGNTTMSFTCSFLTPEDNPEQRDVDVAMDTFGINEFTIFQGEPDEQEYCVSGDILDENLYDLLLNYLEERGITDEFANDLSSLCSDYEHSLYVGLLENVQKFLK